MVNFLHPRILQEPKGSFFLFGPRGVGKSTWLRARFPNASRFDLLNEALHLDLLRDPGRFSAELRALPDGSLVVLDEVQRLPALLNEVHRHIEERRFRFVLCGSSARKLKTAGTNLLAGRAVVRRMHPFVPEELGADFSISDALRLGTLPVILAAPDPEDALDAYVRMYLKEEIQAEANLRNLPAFTRFLPVAALFHAQVLNVSALARDSGVARTTIYGFLEIIEDTLLAWRLPAFTPRLRVRETAHPKLYLADPGLVRALGRRTAGDPSPEERGRLFEGFVATVLRAYRDYRRAFDEWAYWASPARRVEVDFLLERAGERVAIEVKASRRPETTEHPGLSAIAELPTVRRRILVHLGERRMRTAGGVDLLPAADFFRELAEGTLFPA